MTPGTLIFFCGKMGAGKTTLSVRIESERNAVRLSEDEWLAALFPGAITSLEDYVEHAGCIRPVVEGVVRSILRAGTDVVLDFPANTRRQRAWFRGLVDDTGAPHEMIYLDVPDAVCLERIARRAIDQPERAATDTAAMFERVTQYFEEPGDDEGLHVRRRHEHD